LPQVTVCDGRSVDDDFPIVDRDQEPVQRLANRARTTFFWAVDGND
jgi:hypothetical protein